MEIPLAVMEIPLQLLLLFLFLFSLLFCFCSGLNPTVGVVEILHDHFVLSSVNDLLPHGHIPIHLHIQTLITKLAASQPYYPTP